MTTPLPAAPSLEHLRKQAKDLVREREAGPEPLRLSEAQLAVAREYGFASWPRLKAYVERVSAHGPGSRTRSSTTSATTRTAPKGCAASSRAASRTASSSCAPTTPALARRERRRRAGDQQSPTRVSCSRASTDSRAGTASGAT